MTNLITGGAGFIGSHLARLLLASGESVVVLDNLSTGTFDNLRDLAEHPRFKYYIGSVEDTALLAEAGSECETIYHLAAAVGVELIVRDPVRTIETNINGAENVLRFAVRYGKRVVLTSTSEVYGKASKMPFSEDDDVVYGPTSKPRWAYAVSKAVDEFLLRAYVGSKGLQGIVARLFNTVGPRQVSQYGMVVPRFIEQALHGGPITVYGDGTQTRCFTHVMDIVPALHALARLPRLDGQIINLGSSERISIAALADRIRLAIDPSVEIRKVPYESVFGKAFEDMRDREPDLALAKRLIGYAPKYCLDDIIRDIVCDRGAELPVGANVLAAAAH